MFKATKRPYYLDYIDKNIYNLKNFAEFGWDSKDAGINVLVSKVIFLQPFFLFVHIFYDIITFMIWLMIIFFSNYDVWQLLINSSSNSKPFILNNADKLVCSVLPESPSVLVSY